MKLGGKSNMKENVIGTIRKSQFITTYGPGAIVDTADVSVVMGAIDYWENNDEKSVFTEHNLQKVLHVEYFREPQILEKEDMKDKIDFKVIRFPKMHFCPGCNRLMSFERFDKKNGKICRKCGKKIIPSRFIAACDNGHLEDFPYDWWVHNGESTKCKGAGNYDKLKINFNSDSAGLDSIEIECTECGAKRSMEGCMSKGALKGYHCRGSRPWVGYKKEYYDPKKCDREMRGLQRGASNVYFPVTISALTIPPWTKKIHQLIEKESRHIRYFFNKHQDSQERRRFIRYTFAEIIDSGMYTVDEFETEIDRLLVDDESHEFTEYNLYEEEYKALMSNTTEEDDIFKTVVTEVPKDFEEYIAGVSLVKRLQEIQVLRGFRRISPDSTREEPDSNGKRVPREITKLSQESLNWLPAIKLLGEGIFIHFNEEKLDKWVENNKGRYNEMEKRHESSVIVENKFSPQYVFLHTFAHLLIRQLTLECGYSGAALKERIYSTYNNSDVKMAGILIYTSSSDADGSLGGLVRQGESEYLNNTLLNLIQEATWCSSDPLCIESTAQGFNSLNYSACHACTLLPETSCEARNCLLDRVSVVGKMDDRKKGFFGELLYRDDNSVEL